MLTLHVFLTIIAIIFVATVVVLSVPWSSTIKIIAPIAVVIAFRSPSGSVFFGLFVMAVFFVYEEQL